MQSELVFGDTLIVSPGDTVDKLTILKIKKQKIGNDQVQREVELTEVLLWRLIIAVNEAHSAFFRMELETLQSELYCINLEQWDCEDRVRKEQSWEAAKAARDCNTRRVAKKNEINRLFGYEPEQKLYK